MAATGAASRYSMAGLLVGCVNCWRSPVASTPVPVPPRAAVSTQAVSYCTEQLLRFAEPVMVFFDRYQNKLDPDQERRLNDLAMAVAPCPRLAVSIRSHTDDRGPEKLNFELSNRRAALAARYTEEHGVERNRLSVVGLAAASPLTKNDTPQGRARNRRIELSVALR